MMVLEHGVWRGHGSEAYLTTHSLPLACTVFLIECGIVFRCPSQSRYELIGHAMKRSS
jgi:hypothetical protein